jgi:general secretion pathway protein L
MPRSLPPHPADAAAAERRNAAGIWSLDAGKIREIERFDVGPAIILVPTEQVLLLSTHLPLPGLRRRAEALPFAVEDRIAQPLSAVHLALGAELAPQRHLAGVVSHDAMRGWLDAIDTAGLDHARIVPDALALPLPAAGFWSVDLAGGRALIRRDDGTGLALPVDHLVAAWNAGGRPRCIVFGDALPIDMASAGEAAPTDPLSARLAAPALDLRQGPYAPGGQSRHKLARRVALVAALGLIAHGAIAGADTLALRHIAARRATEVRALLAQVAPGAVIGDDVAASAADLLPGSGDGPSSFLPSLVRVAEALKPLGATATLRSIAFDAQAGTLTLQVETADMAALQRVSGALNAQGLSAESGSAGMNQGKAVGSFTIRSRS